jgi:thymidylate synthase (FAD)
MGGDDAVVRSARVSTSSDSRNVDMGTKEEGLINYLMRDRHGSPFEHNAFTFYIEAPIFVFREFMRHRIASYNEESARYKELAPVFYLPGSNRNLVQTGKVGAYKFVPGTEDQYLDVHYAGKESAKITYQAYKDQLNAGIAREVARMVLPVNIYSSMYVTMNARSLMNFLSLRTMREGTHFPSFPQREIEMVAEKMEEFFAEKMPITYETFNKNGRVAP